MKYILDEMGNTVMVIVIIVALFLIMFSVTNKSGNTGILNIMGEEADYKTTTYEDMADIAAVNTYLNRKKPQIAYAPEGLTTIQANKTVILYDYFLVTLAEGNQLRASQALNQECLAFTITVSKITDIKGNDCSSLYQNSTGQIAFPAPGIYTIYFHIVDQDQKESDVEITIPVEGI